MDAVVVNRLKDSAEASFQVVAEEVEVFRGKAKKSVMDANRKNLSEAPGKYTAYLKGNILIASNATDVDPEKDKDKITEITRFTSEYFELIKKTSTEENQLLALQLPDEGNDRSTSRQVVSS